MIQTITTFGDVLRRNAEFYPDIPAVIYGEQRITHRQLLNRGLRLSSALYRLGARHQDRIAILSMNRTEYCDVYSACHLAGFICATVNFRLAAPEIQYVLNDCAPRVVIFEEQYTAIIESIRDQIPMVEHYICIGRTQDWASSFADIMESGITNGAPIVSLAQDVAHLLYTSGTTGRPKGVARTHAGDLEIAKALSGAVELRVNDRALVMMPMFHAGALSNYICSLWTSGTLVLQSKFSPKEILQAIERERVQVVHMAPTIVQAVLDVPDIRDYDVSSLHTIIYAAAPMPVAVLKRGLGIFGPIFLNSWGMTESCGTALYKHLHRVEGTAREVSRLASVGQALPYCQIKTVDENGEDCPVGVPGEIWIRSPGTMAFYWNNSPATIETLRDGWLRTGDLAYMDEEGYVFLVDRKKDMIISGGENIYSVEVEQALMHHPAVADAAVIGVPDDYWGESVKAVVVRKQGGMVSAEELISFCATLIASYKKPKTVEFVDELPRLPSGKINKVVLRQKYRPVASVN